MTDEKRQTFRGNFKQAQDSVVPISEVPEGYVPFREFCYENQIQRQTLRRWLKKDGVKEYYVKDGRLLNAYFPLAGMQKYAEIIKLNKKRK